MLRYFTAGESHGKALISIVEGLPSNLLIDSSTIDRDLKRRQGGHGRGGRMKIESDKIQFLSGVRHGATLGSPVTLLIENRDWENWSEIMAVEAPSDPGHVPSKRESPVTRPRPGHADLSGAIKYNHNDVRNTLERSSARETAIRVAVGAIAKRLLHEFDINVYSWVTEIGGISGQGAGGRGQKNLEPGTRNLEAIFELAESSEVRCPDKEASNLMIKKIDRAKENGDSLGGIFEVVVSGLPVGLGSHVHYDRKVDARLAGAMMSIQAIKGVEIGLGFEEARKQGSEVHDEILYRGQGAGGRGQTNLKLGFYRKTNNAGGIEGGMSNGEDVVIRAAMKPIPTLYRPLMSVDIKTKEAYEASVERSDTCAVPAAAVIGEAVAAIEIARAFLDKFGGDSIGEVKRNYESYQEQVGGF